MAEIMQLTSGLCTEAKGNKPSTVATKYDPDVLAIEKYRLHRGKRVRKKKIKKVFIKHVITRLLLIHNARTHMTK